MKILYKNKGFTLVELIVVIAIVAILSAVSFVGYTQFIKSARNSNASNELNQVYNVIYVEAAKPIELNEFKTTTSGGKLKFVFDELSNEEIKDHLVSLLDYYLDEGFYEGHFVFTKNLITYRSPRGGIASKKVVFNYDLEVDITLNNDGTFDAAVKDVP